MRDYLCHTKSCASYGKSIRKEKLEGAFEDMLQELRPSKELFCLATAMFEDWWDIRVKSVGQEASTLKIEIRKVEGKVEQFLERVVQTDSPTLIRTYETQIKKLEEDKLVMQEKIRKCGRPLDSFQETYRTAINFFENPQKLWLSDHIEHKTLLLRMVFAEKLPYDRKEGYRTAAKSLPFSLLEGLQQGNYEMVEPSGIEPLTSCMPCKRSPS